MIIPKKLKFHQKYAPNTFNSLKKKILNELNDAIRYELTKILYEKYPEESLPLIKDILMRDFNYNFQIVEFSIAKRYSVNDLLNSMIIRSHDKAQMTNNIINNNLIMFALSWKDFATNFDILYDLHLGVFILLHKGTKIIAYLCSRANDPFHFMQESHEISLLKSYTLNHISRKEFHQIVKLFKTLLNLQKKEIVLTELYKEKGNALPEYKLSSNSQHIILYFGVSNI